MRSRVQEAELQVWCPTQSMAVLAGTVNLGGWLLPPGRKGDWFSCSVWAGVDFLDHATSPHPTTQPLPWHEAKSG